MTIVSTPRYALTRMILCALAVSLLAVSGAALAATRVVVGELYSADG